MRKIIFCLFFCFTCCNLICCNASEHTNGMEETEIPSGIDEIVINGKKLLPAGNKTSYYLPYSTTENPAVEIKSSGTSNRYDIKNPSNIRGNVDERTLTIYKIAGNKNIPVYSIEFQVLPKLDLYLCIGQSNMAGRGYMLSEDSVIMSNVYLLNGIGNFEEAQNPLNKYSAIRKEMKMQQIGPSYTFSQTVSEATNLPLGLVVNARGGSNIDEWLKNSDDTLYQSTIRRAKQAMEWGEYKAILWHQGESNSSNEKVAVYPEQLKSLVGDLRKDLGNDSLYFVAGELAYWRGNHKASNAFNKMINTISSFIPYLDVVSAEGLTPLIDYSDPHFDRESQLTLGRRYAEKVLEIVYGL